MPVEMTNAVSLALQRATRRAAAGSRQTVQPLDLFLSLIEEVEGRAAELVVRAGLNREQTLTRHAGLAGNEKDESQIGLSLDPAIDRALALARQIAGEFSADRTVASEHLLLALLRSVPELRQEMENLGLIMAKLEAEIAAMHQGPVLRLEEPLQLLEPLARVDTARIIDANANRAREALRVLEDYCRFSLQDALLTRQIKQLRHALVEKLSTLPAGALLESRDTPRDVGTPIRTAHEEQRTSLMDVVHANAKRLQEALRSLEEFGKLYSPQLGRSLEELRYQSYTVEKALVLGTASRQRLLDASVMVLVSGKHCRASLEWTITEAAAGGASIIQLREKSLCDRELLTRARDVRRWTWKAGLLFILNDRPDLARLVEADGVHLGQEDLPVHEARRIVGPDCLIGVSTHDLNQLRQAVLDGASYVGVGPTFSSSTKAFDDFPGLDFVRQAAQETTLPLFAIGGITPENLAATLKAGARHVAVCQAVCQSLNPRAVVTSLVDQLQAYRTKSVSLQREEP